MASRAGERALSRTSRGGAGCDGTVAAVEALCAWADEARRVRGDVRQPWADGPRTQQCDGLAFSQGASRGAAGSCKPLIRRVRSAGVKATVHRCDSLLMCVLFSAHQAAGSHNAQAFRTPFRGVLRK